MRVLPSALSLLALSHVAISAPYATPDPIPAPGDAAAVNALDLRSPNEADMALAVLEKRTFCRVVNRNIKRIGTSAAVNAFINGSLSLARRVCEDQGAPRCAQYISYIQDGFNILFLVVARWQGGIGVSPTNQEEAGSPVRRAAAAIDGSFLDDLAQGLQEHGFGYSHLENVHIPDLKLETRDGEPALTARVIIKNLTHADEGHDTALNFYDNGGAMLHLPGPGQSLGNSTLAKRFDGEGFKISFTTRQKSLLTTDHQHEMSEALARDWYSVAAFYQADEYIGLVKTEHTANFYFRIIPELQGFGLNYESVDVCGGMAGFL